MENKIRGRNNSERWQIQKKQKKQTQTFEHNGNNQNN